MSKEDDEREFKATGSVFRGLRADLDGAGTAKVFIVSSPAPSTQDNCLIWSFKGHATAQSTGIGGHISARFIPTVERESIDLVDRQVSVWNKELLWIGGYLGRFIYESQLSNINALWSEASKATGSPDEDLNDGTKKWLEAKAVHALKFFTFYPTTPSAIVGLNMESAFFGCMKNSSANDFPIISTVGVRPARSVRSWSPELRSFVKNIPMVPESVVNGAPMMLTSLVRQNMIRDVTFQDVLEELGSRPLSEAEMIECIKWRVGLDTSQMPATQSDVLRQQFLQAAVVSVKQPKDGVEGAPLEERIIPLSSIKTFLPTSSVIPPTLPLPSHTLPFSIGKHFRPEVLNQLFQWTDLSVPDWLDYLVSPEALSMLPQDHRITSDAHFAERVLNVVGKAWGSISKAQIVRITATLQNKTVIPTRSGMRCPKDAYFANANIFADLPILEFPRNTPIRGSMEKVCHPRKVYFILTLTFIPVDVARFGRDEAR